MAEETLVPATTDQLLPAADPDAIQQMISSVTLICGPSGSGKSSLLATMAEYGWETFRKWSSYYLFDSGGIPTQVQALANKGIVRLWRVRTRAMEHGAPTTIYRAANGWWPRKINPVTGQVDPNVELVPPVTLTITARCPEGHVGQIVSTQLLLKPGVCPTCRTPMNAATWKLTQTSKITKGFENRGLCLFDGVPGANTWLLEDLAKRNLGGEASRLGGVVESDGVRFGENNRAQVGFAQNSARQWLGAGNAIPNLVVPPVWTCLLKEGEAEGSRIKGPDIEAGSAKTHAVPQWVGNCLETALVEHDGKKFRRLWLSSYIDPEGFRHPLKVRNYPGYLPAYLEDEDTDDPTQPRFVQFNLGLVHKLLDTARAKYEAQLTERYPDAPGLAGASDFGEEVPIEATPPPAVASAPKPSTPAPGPRRAPGAPIPAPVAPAGVPAPAVAPTTPTPVATPASSGAPPPPPVAATGPTPMTVVQPPARGPVRGPVAAPPGRRPVAAAPKAST